VKEEAQERNSVTEMNVDKKTKRHEGFREVPCGVSFHFIGSPATFLCFGIAKLSDFFPCRVMVATQSYHWGVGRDLSSPSQVITFPKIHRFSSTARWQINLRSLVWRNIQGNRIFHQMVTMVSACISWETMTLSNLMLHIFSATVLTTRNLRSPWRWPIAEAETCPGID